MANAYEDIASSKSLVHQRWEKSWLVCQREERDSNVYAVAKTDATETVQIKLNDLSSFQLHFIINFVLTEPKLAHDQVKFAACSSSHFVMNSLWLSLAQPPK